MSKVVDDGDVLLHALNGASHLQCFDVKLKVKTRDQRSLIWRWLRDESDSDTIHFQAEGHISNDAL